MAKTKILYVEDEEMYQTLVSQILTEQGFEIEVAGTGAEAWRRVEEFRPHLMILDINLPDTDGYALCQRLRQEEMWAKLPILMLTVRRQPDEWRQSFSAGASDYVSKPLNGPDLVERVRACLVKKRARAEGVNNPEVLMAQAAIGGSCSPQICPIVAAAVLTGLRKGDILGLRWANLDFENHLISLVQGKTKTPLTIETRQAV